MNKVILCGRLTRDPEVRYSSGENQTAVARYTLAVDRRFKRQGDEQTADFINCVVFGRGAEFAENYLHQGTKIIAEGRIQTGSYTNKDGHILSLVHIFIMSLNIHICVHFILAYFQLSCKRCGAPLIDIVVKK